MSAFVVPAAFQHIDEALHVGVDIGIGMVRRITTAGLRREVNDHGKAVLRKQRLDGSTIRQVDPDETEARLPLQYFEAGFLQPGIVIVVDDIEADDGTAVAQQALRDMKADKAGCSGDQYRGI